MTEARIEINLNDHRDERNKIFADMLEPHIWDRVKEEVKTNGGDLMAAINKIFLRGMY